MALLWLVALFVPAGSHPLHVVTRCDNSPADSASWKGLSTARGLCSLLPAYFAWQRLFCISTYIDHVPASGILSQTRLAVVSTLHLLDLLLPTRSQSPGGSSLTSRDRLTAPLLP